MNNSAPIRLVPLILLALLAGCSREGPQGNSPEDPDRMARALADAHNSGDARAYRENATRQVLRLSRQSREELIATLDALTRTASRNGAQGLEGAISSTLGTLARRDAIGAEVARERLASLRATYRIDPSASRINARIPFKRAGSPAVFYLPTPIARATLERQIINGTIDADEALGKDLCTEAGLAVFELAWGAERAGQLRELCNAFASGGTGGPGNASMGPLDLASDLECIGTHEPTRAERIESMMQACLASVVTGGNTGNPWATDGVLQPLAELTTEGLHVRTHRNPANPNYPARVWMEEFYDGPPPPPDKPQNENLVAVVLYKVDGTTTRIDYVDGQPSVIQNFDDNGNLLSGHALDKNGQRTESVDMTDDGGYIVTRYDENGKVKETQRYDKDGKPVDENGKPVTPDAGSPGMDWGETPECRTLSVALLLERSGGEMQKLHGEPASRPNPDAPDEIDEEIDCLGGAAATSADASFECRDELKLCPAGQTLDSACACKPAISQVAPQQLCGIFAVCTQERQVDSPDDACCGDVFEDPNAGPGPQPLPVDRAGRTPR